MLTFSRANNAIYGSAFEQAIVNIINYCAELQDYYDEYYSPMEAANLFDSIEE